MISITVPGDRHYTLAHLVLDYNGTLAVDGRPYPSALKLLSELSEQLQIHVVTADTFGMVRREMHGVKCTLTIIPEPDQDVEKLRYVQMVGSDAVIAIGNGRNDLLMIREAAIGIAVIQNEGTFGATLTAADIVCTSIIDALALLQNQKRLIATLRS